MKATVTPRRLLLNLVLKDNALDLDELRQGLQSLVDHASLDVTGNELQDAFQQAVHCYPSLSEEQAADMEETAAWLCNCGHYQEDGLHCSNCGAEPPWGCDCSFCDDVRSRMSDDEWAEDYDGYDADDIPPTAAVPAPAKERQP
jgi:hypothetical protein